MPGLGGTAGAAHGNFLGENRYQMSSAETPLNDNRGHGGCTEKLHSLGEPQQQVQAKGRKRGPGGGSSPPSLVAAFQDSAPKAEKEHHSRQAWTLAAGAGKPLMYL